MNKFLLNIFIAGILISASLCPNWINNPESLSIWLKANITYQIEKEGEDYWKKSFETVRDKSGDCEDFSFLVDKILSDLGYETKVIAVYLKINEKIEGHAICLIKENNKYTFFSNQYYFNKEFDDIYTLLENNYPKWYGYHTIYQDGRRLDYITR